MARQARQPWLDKLANRGSTGSPTGIGLTRSERSPLSQKITTCQRKLFSLPKKQKSFYSNKHYEHSK
ncbi:hypothetical protein [Thermospira aquatica]|uniref:Uncharacterized protein n=1 Tax=Thermospira aquatica TaxID=2828656 RepID=A0AAX3BAF7_9SPIR|nr:hypothetical protein [Thermospira aquatica]URA09242.1 hypothetical protein KDW03_06965 [Thermospira aquatica]